MMNAGETDEKKVDQLKEQLNQKLDVYDKILSKQKYLAGDVNKRFLFCKILYSYVVFLGIYSSRFISFTIWNLVI